MSVAALTRATSSSGMPIGDDGTASPRHSVPPPPPADGSEGARPRYRLALATRLGAALATRLGGALATRLGAALVTRLGAALATRLGAALATRLGAALATRLAPPGAPPGLEPVKPANTAWAAASLAIGTRNGEQLT